MLVLTRKVNQSIAIGDDVHVIVVAIERDKVKLGIVAPPERAIQRSKGDLPRGRHFAVNCAACSRAYAPPRASSSSCVPISTTRPASM